MSSPAVLLVQLGTPDAPTTPALRKYLSQFLGDPRVIEAPRLPWWFFLHSYILRSRPRQSAAKYQKIWDPEKGSPLLFLTQKQTAALQKALPCVPVHFGMQVGNPPVASAVSELIRQGTDRLIVLPMYPQYSATTTGSAMDALFQALQRERRVPALRVVPPYYEHPAYLNAVTTLIQQELATLKWKPDHRVLSFHGLPVDYARRGDPYTTHVKRTTLHLVKRLDWRPGTWTQSFQSLFGRDRWLKPYTEPTLQALAKRGAKRVFIAMPGFTTDCLETIDEIGREAREAFERAGGEVLHRCPCLNDHPAWIEAMRDIIVGEGQGWL
jgi:ferrochelatase